MTWTLRSVAYRASHGVGKFCRPWQSWADQSSLEQSWGLNLFSGLSGFKISTFTRKLSRFDLYPAGLFGYPAAAAGSHASAREYLRKELELGIAGNGERCEGDVVKFKGFSAFRDKLVEGMRC